jgi:hypothetical protein
MSKFRNPKSKPSYNTDYSQSQVMCHQHLSDNPPHPALETLNQRTHEIFISSDSYEIHLETEGGRGLEIHENCFDADR